MAGKARIVIVMSVWMTILGSSLAQFAIPDQYDGFSYKLPSVKVPVIWEVFIDPLCNDCKQTWPIVKQVADLYGSSAVVLIVHVFPSPFHHNAFFASRTLHIANTLNSSLVYSLLELIFERQDSFSNVNTADEAASHVVERMIGLAEELGVSVTAFRDGLNDSSTDQLTRSSFKYGCSRGVVATPTFLVNGVLATGADESWSVSDWRKLLDPLLKTGNRLSI